MNPDLRNFIRRVEETTPEEFLMVKDSISIQYEPTAFVLELAQRGKHPLVFFENIQGTSFKIVTNLFGSRQRCALAMDTTVEQLKEEYVLRSNRRIPPVLVKEAPIKERISLGTDVDLGSLPIPIHFMEDAGPYITAGIVLAKDPEKGTINASFHRCQIKDRNRIGISLHSRRHLWDYQRRAEENGKNLEVAVMIGCHPLIALGTGLSKESIDTDEYHVTGGFLGEPLEVIPCETIPLEVPAQAEIIIEGEILANVREDEGPFGEISGYASMNSTRHVMTVKAISHRKDALFQDIVPGYSQEHNNMVAVPSEPRMLDVLRRVVPSVRDVAYGTTRFHCYISMKKIVEGQPKTAIFRAFAEDTMLKHIIVVDEDVDVKNEQEVLWALSTRMQADNGILLLPNCMGPVLDPSAKNGLTAKMGIDATKPLTGWKAVRCTIPQVTKDRIRDMLTQ